MATLALQTKGRGKFTWDDYRQWPADERWELIGGKAFAMSPSPGFRHQDLSMNLAGCFFNFFRGKKCRPFAAPFDVKLSEDDVVQPDLLVVCDPAQLKDTHVEGPPSLVVEIYSPSSERHDRIRKLALYAKHGVKEYWIVSPFPSYIEILSLDDTAYKVFGTFKPGQILRGQLFPELEMDLTEIFDFPLTPAEEKILQEEKELEENASAI